MAGLSRIKMVGNNILEGLLFGPRAYSDVDAETVMADAKSGDQQAILVVGTKLAEGLPLTVGRDDVLSWLAGIGDTCPPAHHLLAHIFERDHQVAASIEFYRKAAKQGYLPAKFRLARKLLSRETLGEQKDGRLWLERAATDGHMFAKRDLAVMRWKEGGRFVAFPKFMRAIISWMRESYRIRLRNPQDIRLEY